MRMKVIKQHDARDCGAACLATIAGYYGKDRPLSYYRELTKTDKNGTNIYGIVDGAQKIGISARACTGNMDELLGEISRGTIAFPFIANVIINETASHFIVISGIKNETVFVADPSKGRTVMSLEEFSGKWTGAVVCFELSDRFMKDEKKKKTPLGRFMRLLKGQYRKLAGIIALSIIVSMIGIAGSFVFEIMIDEFANDTEISEASGELCEDDCTEDHEHHHGGTPSGGVIGSFIARIPEHVSDYNRIFIAIIILYMLSAAIQMIRGYLIIGVAKKIDIGLSLSYYDHIIDLPVSSVNVRQTGEYMSRFADTATIRNAISNATLTLILDTMMAVGCGLVLYLQNSKMFLISLSMILAYAIVLLLYRRPVSEANRSVMENNAVVQSYLKESLDGIETLKASNAGEKAKNRLADKFGGFIDSAVKNSRISVSQDVVSSTVELIGTVAIIWAGFSMVLSNSITVGSLISFYVLLGYFTGPVKNLISLQPTIQTAVVAAERLNDILDLSVEQRKTDGKKLPGQLNVWEADGVDFRYGNRELVLSDVSLRVARGEKVAVVGESGSGKTTLAKLMLRFYEPEKGSVRVDGQDLKEFDVDDLRSKIAYVDQDTFLFSDTIRNNLLLADPDADEAELKKACESSRAADFIENLPMKYDTLLEENGTNISGGQRQRLAIARALLKKPQLLILDEATSNLDSITESAIRNTLFDFSDDMACIIIAHRLSTVKNCDRIYVMEQGRVVEEGTHDELLSRNGKYRQLWDRQ